MPWQPVFVKLEGKSFKRFPIVSPRHPWISIKKHAILMPEHVKQSSKVAVDITCKTENRRAKALLSVVVILSSIKRVLMNYNKSTDDNRNI